MQGSKVLVALVCVLLLSGAEMSAGAGAGAVAVPRALLRGSVVSALSHAAGGVGDSMYDCCRIRPSCCLQADGSPASDDDFP